MSFIHIGKDMRALTIIGSMALNVCLASSAQAAQPSSDIIGTWKLSAILDSSDISPIDDRQARRLLGKTLKISEEKVELAGEICSGPDFERSQEETARYFRENAHVASGRLGLPDPVTVVSLSCTDVYLKSPNKLVVHWKGFFFDAIRIRAIGAGKRLP